jgi:hypothetical protein
VIAFAQTFSTSKVGFALAQAGYRINATSFENNHFRPRTHQAIGEQDIAWEKDIPQGAKHPQLALSLACVAADSQIKNRTAGERKDSRDSR